MKTAEEWQIIGQRECDAQSMEAVKDCGIEFTKRIQLDAYKAGLTKATEIVRNHYTNNDVGFAKAVESFRDSLKELP